MKRKLLLFLLLLAPTISAQDFDKINSTVVVAGEFRDGSKMVGNGVIVCHGDQCCLVTADHLLKLDNRYTSSVTIIIPTNPSLSNIEISEKLGSESEWEYHAGGIFRKIYAYNVCFWDTRVDIRGISIEYPYEFLKNGLILTAPTQTSDIADDSEVVAGDHVATVGSVFNTTSRLFVPKIDTGSVVSLRGDKVQYSGKGIEGLSGGPVWMRKGDRVKLVGIHSYHDKEYESYAIKASIIKSHMK